MDPVYLRSCSHGMVEAIKEGDPNGVWLLETWVFSYDGIWDDNNILDFCHVRILHEMHCCILRRNREGGRCDST